MGAGCTKRTLYDRVADAIQKSINKVKSSKEKNIKDMNTGSLTEINARQTSNCPSIYTESMSSMPNDQPTSIDDSSFVNINDDEERYIMLRQKQDDSTPLEIADKKEIKSFEQNMSPAEFEPELEISPNSVTE